MTSRSGVIRRGRSGADADGVRTRLPSPDALSRQSWVGEAAADALPRIARCLSMNCEPFGPRLVFLAGSAIHGELCGIVAPDGGRIFLSDLDVGIVTVEPVSPEIRDRTLKELEQIPEEGPRALVGFYLLRDLGRHSPTMGLVEATRCGYVLDGEADLLRRFRMPPPLRMPVWEARRLLANRVLEYLDATAEEAPACRRVYAAAKVIADTAAVVLLGRRLYSGGGVAERLAGLLDLEGDGPQLERIEAWTKWRIEPDYRSTPLGLDVATAARSPRLAGEVRDAARWSVRRLSGTASIPGVFTHSAVRGRAWARSWKRWLRDRRASILSVGVGGIRRTPRVLLWEAAVEYLIGEPRRAAQLLARLEGTAAEPAFSTSERIGRIAKRMDREGID